MIYFDREEKPTNKAEKMDAVNNDDVEIANKVVYESVYSITS